MTHITRGDYGLIDLLAVTRWNLANQRAIKANRQPAVPNTYCIEDACASDREGRSPRCTQHKRERRKAVSAYQSTDGARAAARARMRTYRARKKEQK